MKDGACINFLRGKCDGTYIMLASGHSCNKCLFSRPAKIRNNFRIVTYSNIDRTWECSNNIDLETCFMAPIGLTEAEYIALIFQDNAKPEAYDE